MFFCFFVILFYYFTKLYSLETGHHAQSNSKLKATRPCRKEQSTHILGSRKEFAVMENSWQALLCIGARHGDAREASAANRGSLLRV